MTTTAMPNRVNNQVRQQALEERVMLLCPTIGWWKGQYQLPRQQTHVTVDGKTGNIDNDAITTPRAKLVTDKYPLDRDGKPWKKRFQKIESRMVALKEKYSLPFPINGVRIVPKRRGDALLDELYGLTLSKLRRLVTKAQDEGDVALARELELRVEEVEREEGYDAPDNTPVFNPDRTVQSIAYELHTAAKEFARSWSDIRREIAEKNEVFNQVAKSVPLSSADIRRKFYIDVVPVELAGTDGNAEILTEGALSDHADVVREACQRRVEEAIEEMIRGPRKQLADALSNLHNLIERDGRVSDRSFKPVREAISKIRLFGFVANDELLQKIKELENRLNITSTKQLDRATAASSGFSAAIESFMEEVSNADKQRKDLEEFGKEFRAIDLD